MCIGFARDAWLAERVRDWQLANLRFAITRREGDNQAALGIAEEIDRLAFRSGRSPFTFFVRTSIELAEAIADADKPERIAVLRRYCRMIENDRLRQAMAAAIGLETARHPASTRMRSRKS